MRTEIRCRKCGEAFGAVVIEDRFGGACPKCVAGFAFEEDGGIPTRIAPEPPPLKIGAVFRGMEVTDLLGQGGMGVVYKARQAALDRVVALKILSPRLAADPEFAQRFGREARVLAALHHPGIVHIYEFGREGDLYYLVMEYVDGFSLRGVLRERRLDPKEALAIVPQICEALEYAHTQGVVHRDIKPENILIDRGGRVKIADFGLARMAAKEDERVTKSNVVMGTPAYMAPEQHEGAKDVDHRADIYSLGVVFYEMLTGELPVGRFEAPSQRVRIDVRLDEVVLKALEKRRERRYQRAAEVKTEIETLDSSAPPPTTDPGDRWWLARSARSRLAIRWTLALVAVAGFVCFASYSHGETGSPPRTTTRMGFPDAWYVSDQGSGMGGQVGIDFLTWSFGLGVVGIIATCLLARIWLAERRWAPSGGTTSPKGDDWSASRPARSRESSPHVGRAGGFAATAFTIVLTMGILPWEIPFRVAAAFAAVFVFKTLRESILAWSDPRRSRANLSHRVAPILLIVFAAGTVGLGVWLIRNFEAARRGGGVRSPAAIPSGLTEQAEVDHSRLRVKQLSEECETHRREKGRYPSDDWDRPRLINDAWGRPFVYRNHEATFPKSLFDPTAHNKQTFDLYSAGPDGIDEKGGGDDIGNW